MSEAGWVVVCGLDAVGVDDVLGVEARGVELAIYRTGAGEVFATDGICTHEQALLSDGFVFDGVIECPMHNGRFDIRTGEALGAPACVALKTYPTRVDGDKVLVKLG